MSLECKKGFSAIDIEIIYFVQIKSQGEEKWQPTPEKIEFVNSDDALAYAFDLLESRDYIYSAMVLGHNKIADRELIVWCGVKTA